MPEQASPQDGAQTPGRVHVEGRHTCRSQVCQPCGACSSPHEPAAMQNPWCLTLHAVWELGATVAQYRCPIMQKLATRSCRHRAGCQVPMLPRHIRAANSKPLRCGRPALAADPAGRAFHWQRQVLHQGAERMRCDPAAKSSHAGLLRGSRHGRCKDRPQALQCLATRSPADVVTASGLAACLLACLLMKMQPAQPSLLKLAPNLLQRTTW